MNFDELHHHSQSECSFLTGDPYQKWQCASLGMFVLFAGDDVNFDELHHESQTECSFLMGDPYQKWQCNSLGVVV